MAKDTEELDDFNFDDGDEFDFSEFDNFNAEPPDLNARQVVSQSTGNALKGFGSALKDRNLVVEAMGDSLPRGYRLANDQINELASFRDEFMDGMEPVKKEVRDLVKNNEKLITRVLPKKWGERLNEWASDDVAYSGEEIDPREAEITSAIGDIFKLQQAQHAEEKQEEQVDELKEKEEERKRHIQDQEMQQGRHEGQVKILSAIRSGVDRQVAYQDEINAKYQQKTLEIQYRQLFALRDLLETSQRHASNVDELLAGIRTNTALPEHVKVRDSERLAGAIKDKSIDSMMDTASEIMSGVFDRSKENLIKRSSDYLRDKVSQVGMLGQFANTLFSDDTPAEMRGIRGLISVGAESAGKQIARKAVEQIAPSVIEDIMGMDASIEEKGKMIEYMIDNRDDFLVDFSNTSHEQTGLRGKALDFLKDSIVSGKRTKELTEDRVADADEAVAFTRKIERSIVEVIPGYLQRQLKVLKQIFLKREDVDSEVYDITTGSFISESKHSEHLQERIFRKTDREDLNNQANLAIKHLINEKDFTEPELEAIKIAVIDRLSDPSKSSTIEALAKARYETLPDELSIKFKKAISRKFLDGKGKLSTGNIDAASIASDELRSLRSRIPNMAKEMEQLRRAGYKDILTQEGFLKQDSFRGNDLDYLTFWNMSQKGVGDKENVESPKGDMEGLKGPTGSFNDTNISSAKDAFSSSTALDELYKRQGGFIGSRHPSGDFNQVVKELKEINIGIRDTIEKIVNTNDLNSASLNRGSSQQELLDELVRINESLRDDKLLTLSEEKKKLLEEIRDTLTFQIVEGNPDLPSNAGQRRTLFSGMYQRSKNLGGRAGRFIRRTFGLVNAGKDKALDLAKGTLDFGTKLATPILSSAKDKTISTVEWAVGKGKQVGDIHVRGRLMPALTKLKMDAGEYIDGKGNLITSIEDIVKNGGPIYDKISKKIVLTIDDIERGLTSKDGKSIIGKGVDLLKKTHDNIRSVLDPSAKFMWDMGKSIIKAGKSALEKEVDIYVAGEKEPRIVAHLLTRGHYFTGDLENRKIIYSWKEIDGNVYNGEGKLVLSVEDMKKGLVDENGNEIKELKDKIASLVAKFVMMPFKLAGKMKNWVKGKFKGDVNIGGFGGGIGKQGHNLLKDILTVLVAHTGYEGELLSDSDPTPDGKKGTSIFSKVKNIFKRKEKDENHVSLKERVGSIFSKEKREDIKRRLEEAKKKAEESKLVKGAKGLGRQALDSKAGKFIQTDVNTIKDAFNKEQTFTPYDGNLINVPMPQKGNKVKEAFNNLSDGISQTKSAEAVGSRFSRLKDKFKRKPSEADVPEYPGEEATDEEKEAWLKQMVEYSKKKGDKLKLPNLKGIFSSKGKETKEDEEKTSMFSKMGEYLKDIRDKTNEKDETLKSIADNTTKEEGPRKGSWQYLRSKKQDGQKLDADGNPVDKKEEYKGDRWKESGDTGAMFLGGFSQIADILGGIGGTIRSIFTTLTTIAGVLGAGRLLNRGGGGVDIPDGPDSNRRGRNNRPRTGGGGRRGLLRRAGASLGSMWGSQIRGVGNVVRSAGSFVGRNALRVARFAGTNALRGAFMAAKGLGTVLLSKPALIIGAIALTAYAGYRFYKYLTRFTVSDVDEIRYAQYGFDAHDEDRRKSLITLEGVLLDQVTYNDGVASLESADIEPSKILEAFGLDEDDEGDQEAIEELLVWYQNRFVPVYLSHLTALKRVTDDDKLFKTEDLTDSQRLQIARAVNFSDTNVYGVSQSPFMGHPLTYVGDDVTRIVEAKINELSEKVGEDETTSRNTTTLDSLREVDDEPTIRSEVNRSVPRPDAPTTTIELPERNLRSTINAPAETSSSNVATLDNLREVDDEPTIRSEVNGPVERSVSTVNTSTVSRPDAPTTTIELPERNLRSTINAPATVSSTPLLTPNDTPTELSSFERALTVARRYPDPYDLVTDEDMEQIVNYVNDLNNRDENQRRERAAVLMDDLMQERLRNVLDENDISLSQYREALEQLRRHDTDNRGLREETNRTSVVEVNTSDNSRNVAERRATNDEVDEAEVQRAREFSERYSNNRLLLTDEERENIFAEEWERANGVDRIARSRANARINSLIGQRTLEKLEEEGISQEAYRVALSPQRLVRDDSPVADNYQTNRQIEAASIQRESSREATDRNNISEELRVVADVDVSEMVGAERESHVYLADIAESLQQLLALQGNVEEPTQSSSTSNNQNRNRSTRNTRSNRNFSYNMS